MTGYYEPVLEARRAPAPGFEAAIPSPPANLIRIDLGRFDPALAGRRVYAQADRGAHFLEAAPLPERGEIQTPPGEALAFADPVEVFFLQIQGSGRIRLEDGTEFRAAFAAHNEAQFRSLANVLIEKGEITRAQASKDGLKAWLRRVGPDAARAAMAANPRFVWFARETITDPALGPRGALGVALTPMASLAIDPAKHPLGGLIFVETLVPQGPGDWRGAPFAGLFAAQDVGGAILGPTRGDLYFGTGEAAGARAGVMNHEARVWTLLPKGVDPPDNLLAGPPA